MRIQSIVLSLLTALPLSAPTSRASAAPAQDIWQGDIASARSFMLDSTKIYTQKYKSGLPGSIKNTISALEAVAQGKIMLACSMRAPNPNSAIEKDLSFTPLAWDALVVVVHPKNPLRSLTATELRDIYLGKIASWQAQSGIPAKRINLYAVAGPLDGIEYSLRQILFGNGATGVAASRWYLNTQQLEEAVSIDPAGMGVSLLSNVHKNSKLKVLAIENILPSPTTMSDGSYLLVTPLYLVSRRGQPQSQRYVDLLLGLARTDPRLQRTLRDRQMLPFSDQAESFIAGHLRRASVLTERLGVMQPALFATAPPVPAPHKSGRVNALRAKPQDMLARKTAKTPAIASSMNIIAAVPADPATFSSCRPRPVCS